MSTSQQLLILGGLLVLSLLALNFFRASNIQYDMKFDNEAIITATSLGQSIIEEMNSMAFDEKCVEYKTSAPDSLTPFSYFGPDIDETSRVLFDDLDDFHGYTMADSSMSLGNFYVSVRVEYVLTKAPDVVSSTQTYSKRASVKVYNTYLLDTLRLVYAFSY
jgi:hypothetical protein